MKRAMAMAITMVCGEEGDSDGNNGVGQGTATAIRRAMVTAMRVAGDKEGKSSKGGKGKGNGDEGGGRQRGG